MVYIHAESYENGDSSLYGSEKLMDQSIVLVTFNYRLGILGFLSTEDHNSIGNFGLYDQILALKWIQDNIVYFGGNPKQVTLFGQGAGASSIMYHLMSDSSSSLFHKAILQSGSNLCNWAIERKPLEFAKRLADKVGCFRSASSSEHLANTQSKQYPTSIQDKIREIIPINGVFRNARTINRMDSDENQNQDNQINDEDFFANKLTNREIVDCLRHTSLTKLLKAQSEDKIFGEFPQHTAPTIQKDGLIKGEPFQNLKLNKFHKKPIIIGLNKDETAYFIPLLLGDNKPALTYDYLEKNVIPRFVDATISFKNKSKIKIVSEIMLQYFTSVNWSNMTQIIQQFVSVSLKFSRLILVKISFFSFFFKKMSTDGAYGNCIDETAKLYSRYGGLVYFYSYEYRATNSMLDLLVNLQNEVNVQPKQNRLTSNGWFEFDRGVCHGDELFSIFSLKTGNLRPYSEHDLYTQKRLITLWTGFASTNFNENKTSSSFYNQMSYSSNQFDPSAQWNYRNKLAATNLFLGANAIWPLFNEDTHQYLVLSDELRVQTNYRKQELDFWKLLFDSELLLTAMERTSEQFDYSNLTNHKWATFAYTMLTTTIILMIVISILLVILYWYSKKTRTFKTSIVPGICQSSRIKF